MSFGGPVWHCSVRHPARDAAIEIAYNALQGIGDANLGQWGEWHTAFHLRRRLSAKEAEAIGPVVDIRNTTEAWRRFKALPAFIRSATGGVPL